MLLREINIGNLTIILDEDHDDFEIKALDKNGDRVFMHVFDNYEIVRGALDDITDLIKKESVSDDDILEILRFSKDK